VQRLRAFVFISHHRTHRFALLQQQFGDRAPYRADAARRAGDQNGVCHVFSLLQSKLNCQTQAICRIISSARRPFDDFCESDYESRVYRFARLSLSTAAYF